MRIARARTRTRETARTTRLRPILPMPIPTEAARASKPTRLPATATAAATGPAAATDRAPAKGRVPAVAAAPEAEAAAAGQRVRQRRWPCWGGCWRRHVWDQGVAPWLYRRDRIEAPPVQPNAVRILRGPVGRRTRRSSPSISRVARRSSKGTVYQTDDTGRVVATVTLPYTATGLALHRNRGLVAAIPRDGGKILKIDERGMASTILERDRRCCTRSALGFPASRTSWLWPTTSQGGGGHDDRGRHAHGLSARHLAESHAGDVRRGHSRQARRLRHGWLAGRVPLCERRASRRPASRCCRVSAASRRTRGRCGGPRLKSQEPTDQPI